MYHLSCGCVSHDLWLASDLPDIFSLLLFLEVASSNLGYAQCMPSHVTFAINRRQQPQVRRLHWHLRSSSHPQLLPTSVAVVQCPVYAWWEFTGVLHKHNMQTYMEMHIQIKLYISVSTSCPLWSQFNVYNVWSFLAKIFVLVPWFVLI